MPYEGTGSNLSPVEEDKLRAKDHAEWLAKYYYPNGQLRDETPPPDLVRNNPLDGYIKGKVCDINGELLSVSYVV